MIFKNLPCLYNKMSVKFNKSQSDFINAFIDSSAEKFNINKNNIKTFWQQYINDNNKKTELNRLKKDDLIQICKDKGLSYTGKNKGQLVNLINKSNTGISKQINKFKPIISIKKNSFGNFVHDDTKFVFDKVNKFVIGKQNQDGTINNNINETDIDLCNKYKFKYVLPENLDVNVEEVEEEEEEEEEVEEEEVEEEEEEVEEEVEEEEEEEEEEVEEEEVEEEEEEVEEEEYYYL